MSSVTLLTIVALWSQLRAGAACIQCWAISAHGHSAKL